MGSRPTRAPRLVAAVGLSILLAACALVRADQPLERARVTPTPLVDPASLAPRPLVGAHHYEWYPGNWGWGTLRAQLDPPQQPQLGWYDSRDTAVAEQQIAWASAHGIDFFTLDWWPRGHQENQAGIDAFLAARNLADIAFAIFYETWDLGFDAARGYTDLDAPGVRAEFVADMAELADRYFANPSYLRVAGRPVVVLYLTRVLVGDVAGAMADARAAWRQRGYDPFVVGDEMFWQVTVDGQRAFTDVPQAGRVRLFDAVTAYNPYESQRTSHAGYAATSAYLPDVEALYQRYRDATAGAVPIVPDVLPGYNDRGVRPRLDHYVIPRALAPDQADGTFLAEQLRRLADPWFDPRAPLVFVTSWNEWNEDTGIEPLAAAPPTAADTAGDGISRTTGVRYEGFGTRYLEILRDHYVAVAGTVRDADGQPLPGVLVTARRGGAIVAQAATDAAGRYTLPRAQIGTDPVTIVAERQAFVVSPDASRTVTADFGPAG